MKQTPNAEISNKYVEFVSKLEAKFGSFILDARAGCINRAAALRARKFTSEIREDLKNFRMISLEVEHARSPKNASVIEAED